MPGSSHFLVTRLTCSVLAAGLLSLGAGAIAQPPGPIPTHGPGGPASRADARPPETRTELKSQLEARFDRMDLNHDGKIDEKDAELRHQQHITAMFERLDTDKNGSISKEEFAAAEEHREDRMGPPRFGRGGPDGPGRAMLFHRAGGPEGRMMMRGPLPFAPPPRGGREGFGRGGSDHAPREPLTKSAFVDRGLARFDKIDTNHDGKISPAERDAARGARHGFREHAKSPPPPKTSPQSGQ